MTAFACGFSAFDRLLTEMLISLATILGAALTLVVIAVAAAMNWSKSRESQ